MNINELILKSDYWQSHFYKVGMEKERDILFKTKIRCFLVPRQVLEKLKFLIIFHQ